MEEAKAIVPNRPTRRTGSTGFEPDALIAAIRDGIGAALEHQAHVAATILLDRVWLKLWSNRWHPLLRLPDLGPLLLRSQIQLGHALMNAGRWPEAEMWLLRAVDSVEYLGEWRPTAWVELPWPVSAVPEEVATEAHGYLATILRDTNLGEAELHQGRALAAVTRRPAKGENELRTLGNSLRGSARLRLTADRADPHAIASLLGRARANLERADDRLMVAATDMQHANLKDRLIRVGDSPDGRRRLDELLSTVAEAVKDRDSPMLKANFSIDSIRLRAVHGMGQAADADLLRVSARSCVANGYGDQARKLLALDQSVDWLPADLFRRVAQLAYWTAVVPRAGW